MQKSDLLVGARRPAKAGGAKGEDGLRRMKPRQLSFAFADSPPGGGKATGSDASERRDFLLHKAKGKKTRGFVAEAADTGRLLEDVASEANLARALLNVVRNKGAPGVDGQTVEAVEAQAPAILARLRDELLTGRYRPAKCGGSGFPSQAAASADWAFPT